MTETLVVRLKQAELARVDAAARKRRLTRSAYVRHVLKRETSVEPQKGAGWAQRLKELDEQARDLEIKGHPEDEIREMGRNRWK